MKKIIASALTIALTAVLIGTSFTSCKDDKDDGVLYLYNWTYYTPDSVLEKFEQEFNCTVKVDTFDSNEVMYAKLKAGAKGYDITFPS